MIKVIVGLGNPGEKYKNNRHNVGFMFIDYMITLLNGYMVKKTKNYLAIQPSNHEFFLAKPTTYMNLSGKVVKKILTDYRLPITDLLVVHDDLDIPLGKFKIQKGIGPKLHNGIESVEKSLGTKNFWRVRIGIDNRRHTGWIDGETYTLENFRPEEKEIIDQAFPKIWEQLNKQLAISY